MIDTFLYVFPATKLFQFLFINNQFQPPYFLPILYHNFGQKLQFYTLHLLACIIHKVSQLHIIVSLLKFIRITYFKKLTFIYVCTKGTTTYERPLMTSELHRLWCFFGPTIRILQGEVLRYLKKHHKRCSCDIINGCSYVVACLQALKDVIYCRFYQATFKVQ